MYLATIRARLFLGALLAMGLVTPLPANSQSTSFLGIERPDAPLPRRVPQKPGRAFRASELFLAGGTAFDMTTTARLLGHPTVAERSDGSYLTSYYTTENGWAGVFGKRDTVSTVVANVAMNAMIDRYSRTLYARGGRWRTVGIGMNVLKGTINSMAAVHNIRFDQRIDQQVRLATGYKGQIIWSH
ncbi:MAG TPA: hypothetical protein VMA75_04530 [Candidatus Paceibacterota bacterium]|nr:hypothetical protein [Candidatus Paceibacterota bacterium]